MLAPWAPEQSQVPELSLALRVSALCAPEPSLALWALVLLLELALVVSLALGVRALSPALRVLPLPLALWVLALSPALWVL